MSILSIVRSLDRWYVVHDPNVGTLPPAAAGWQQWREEYAAKYLDIYKIGPSINVEDIIDRRTPGRS